MKIIWSWLKSLVKLFVNNNIRINLMECSVISNIMPWRHYNTIIGSGIPEEISIFYAHCLNKNDVIIDCYYCCHLFLMYLVTTSWRNLLKHVFHRYLHICTLFYLFVFLSVNNLYDTLNKKINRWIAHWNYKSAPIAFEVGRFGCHWVIT